MRDQYRSGPSAVNRVIAIRFGLFGAAHLYLAAHLAADVRHRFPDARLVLIGQNSMDTIDRVRRGHLEAALVALPIDDDALQVRPVLHDEIVYVTAVADRVRSPVTAADLGKAQLVLSEVTWGDNDFARQQLRRAVQSAGGVLRLVIEVENVETALEIAALGLADAITARSVLRRQQSKPATRLYSAPSNPPLYDHFAVVCRRNAVLSNPIQAVIELAVARMREFAAARVNDATGRDECAIPAG